MSDMMHDKSRAWLIAACYGLWAAICAAATFAAVSALWLGFWNSSRSRFADLIELLHYAVPTIIVATRGWAILHLRGRRPSAGAYVVLAVAIVIVVHLVLMCSVAFTTSGPPGGFFAAALIYVFVFHFWFTIPIAVGATGLFVWCLTRWQAP